MPGVPPLDKYFKNLQARDSKTELVRLLAGYLLSQSSSNKLFHIHTYMHTYKLGTHSYIWQVVRFLPVAVG